MERIEITPRGPFSLRAAAGFGFGPNEGHPPPFDGVLRYAFPVDGDHGYAGVELRQERDDGPVTALVHGTDQLDAVGAQLERVLSLDHDGEAFLAVGSRDHVIGRLQTALPGVRPVLFHSPYEAAAWSVISARQRGIPAATVRRSLAERFGATFELAGQAEVAFPQPSALLSAGALDVPGLNEVKQQRLRGVAEAAYSGSLDATSLRRLGPADAATALQRLSGIGPFYAGLIVLRSVGFADATLSVAEPKLLAHVTRIYELDQPATLERFNEIAEAWRPFRTWAMVLVRLAGDRRIA